MITPTGFSDAYQAYVDGGWNALQFDEKSADKACHCYWQHLYSRCGREPISPSALPRADHRSRRMEEFGTDEQKEKWLPKLVTGEWTGTMVLTEPNAGSDVGALRTQPNPLAITIEFPARKYTTYGEHDLTDNIVHMVLARTPNAPPGTRGISLIVPKFLVNEDGRWGGGTICGLCPLNTSSAYTAARPA